MPTRRWISLSLALFLLATPAVRASWFSDVTGIDVNVTEATVHIDPPTPQEIPQRIQHAVDTFPAAVEGPVRDIFNLSRRIVER